MTKALRVITTNTAYGNALNQENIYALGTPDIVLAQEVLGFKEYNLEKNLGSIGLTVSVFHAESGLLIATNPDRIKTLDARYSEIYPSNPLNGVLSAFNMKPRFRERGLLLAQLQHEGDTFIVATAHPIVCIRALARRRQVDRILNTLIAHDKHEPLVFGADMNHYPGPRAVDLVMLQRLQLQALQLPDPTFELRGTRHAWLKVLGFPDGYLDVLAFRGFSVGATKLIDVQSDHKAIQTDLTL